MSEQHLNTGAAALGALEPHEQAAFEEHLAQCAPCRDELAGFRETVVRLAATTEVVPPSDLRSRVMEQVRRTPQLPPVVDGTTDASSPAGEPAPVPAPAEESSSGDAVPREATPVLPPTPPVVPIASRRRVHPAAWLSAAAAAVALAVTTGVLVNQDRTPPTAAECVAAASDAQNLEPGVGSGGHVDVSAECGAAVVSMPEDMPELPDGQVYQLWIMAGADARSVGLVSGGEEMVLEGIHASDTDIGVSIEPGPRGSTAPTSDPVWVVTL